MKSLGKLEPESQWNRGPREHEHCKGACLIWSGQKEAAESPAVNRQMRAPVWKADNEELNSIIKIGIILYFLHVIQ